MRKDILLAFLFGMVLPLTLLVAVSSGEEAVAPDVESDGLSDSAAVDAGTRITVLSETGAIQQMTLDAYLAGVVLAEMPADFEPEALKAQAVVARTYTCKRLGGNAKHESAVVCMDAGCCQGYMDPGSCPGESVEKIRAAICATDGQVLIYGGELIDATYFSCSGGSTEDAVAVWGQDVPYLQAVESPGEEDSPRYSDTVSFQTENFLSALGISGAEDPEEWLGPVTYTEGGGVDTIEICGMEFSGTQLRSILGLRSTAFEIRVEDGQVIIETRGFGHRVGMSQYGAQAMAGQGSTYEEILAHYYQGTELAAMRAE